MLATSLAGSIGPKSLAVTGRLADAWLTAAAQDWRSTLVATSRKVIDESAVDAGRDPSEIAPAVREATAQS